MEREIASVRNIVHLDQTDTGRTVLPSHNPGVVTRRLAIAQRIVKDLIAQRTPADARPVMFEAQAQLQVALGNLAARR